MLAQQVIELLTEHWTYGLLSCFALIALFSILSSYMKAVPINIHTKKPLPAIGLPKSYPWFFPKLRSRFAAIKNIPEWVEEGYHKYSKKGEAYMIHSAEGDMVILPGELIGEVKNLPVNQVDLRGFQTLCLNYTFDKLVATDHFHVPIIRKDLTSKLGNTIPTIVEEIDLSMKHFIAKMAEKPDEDGWQKVNIYELILKVVARTSHRVFVGEELCREEAFLDTVINYATSVLPTALAMNCFPSFTWPIVGLVLTLPLRRLRKQARKHLEPVVKKRIAAIQSNTPDSERPSDILQWIVEASLARGGEYATMDAITVRMLMFAFAAIHTTSTSGTNTFYDLAYLSGKTAPGEKTPLDVLRDELMTVFPPPHDFNKRYMQKLQNMDAFLKETTRVNMVNSITSDRVVTGKAGLTTSTGVHFPYGSSFAFPGLPRMKDNDIYKDGAEHQYTRFYRGDASEKESPAAETQSITLNEKSNNPASEKKLDRYMVTITDEYPVFGAGIHACPGRFFAANELRVLVSWFLLHYDIKPIETRPKSPAFLWTELLDTTAILEIRPTKVEE